MGHEAMVATPEREKPWQEGQADAPQVPEGWKLIPAGVEVRVRVDRAWVGGGKGKPFLLVTPGGEIAAEDAETLGPARTATAVVAGPSGCGPTRSAHLVTTAGVLYRP